VMDGLDEMGVIAMGIRGRKLYRKELCAGFRLVLFTNKNCDASDVMVDS
jgi:hypothetical protein